jgi:Secretion system C-terminal sorting domain
MRLLFYPLFFLFISITMSSRAGVYVSTTGLDVPGGGGSTNPFRTLSYAVQNASAGDTVYINPGTYTDSVATYIDKPLTVLTTGSGPVVLDGSARFGALVNLYMIAIVNTHDVLIKGLKLQNCIGNSWKGIWVLNNYLSTAASRNITIENCTLTNIGWISNDLTTLPDTTKATIPLSIQGASSFPLSNVSILNDTIYNCATGWSEGIEVTGNVIGFGLSGNLVYKISNIGIGIAGNYSSSGAPDSVNRARNGVVEHNIVHHCMSGIATSAGIYLDGATGVVVRYNKMYQNGAGLSIGGEQPTIHSIGMDTVYGNLIYNNSIAGALIGTGTLNPIHTVQNTFVWNNTFYKNRTGETVNGISTVAGDSPSVFANNYAGEILLQNTNALSLRNNIIYPLIGKIGITALDNYTTIGYTSNNNLFFHDDGRAIIVIGDSILGFNGYTSLPPYYFATPGSFASVTGGLEDSSHLADPTFTNDTIFDLSLTSRSHAVDIGNSYNSALSGTVDYAGNPRVYGSAIDAGAYELQVASTLHISYPRSAGAFNIYPNPADESIILLPELSMNNARIRIVDMLGNSVYVSQSVTTAAGNAITIPLAGIPRGIYLLVVDSEGTNMRAEFIRK